MVSGEPDVFIHIESNYIFEGELTCFDHAYEGFVCRDWGRTGWKTEDERTVRGRIEVGDALAYVVCDVLAYSGRIVADNETYAMKNQLMSCEKAEGGERTHCRRC